MSWKIDKRGARFGQLSIAAQAKWDLFQNAIHQGQHPAEAAKLIGDSHYKVLDSKLGRFQIRLDYANRATFLIRESSQTVEVSQVGGHT